VTKLSLLLKVLEGESAERLDAGLRLFHERALPDLGNNIKCGNSLIGPDFYDDTQMNLFDEEERLRINVFDWHDEFRDIMRAGGFDAVIGNPPYVLLQSLGMPPVFDYLGRTYASARYKLDTYQIFLEKGLLSSAPGAYVGFITPNTFLRNKHARALRQLILTRSLVQTLQLHDYPVFSGASVDTCVIVMRATSEEKDTRHKVHVTRLTAPLEVEPAGQCEQGEWSQRDDLNFDIPGDQGSGEIIARLFENSVPLGDFATAYFGIQTFDRNRYVSDRSQNRSWRPCIDGVNIGRYRLKPSTEWVCFSPDAIKSGGKQSVYENARIGVRQIGRVPVATLLPGGVYSLNTIYNVFFTKPVKFDLRFILGLLCSRLLGWYWEHHFFDQKRTFPKVKKGPLLSLPIAHVDFANPTDTKKHTRIVSCVQEMLDLHEQLPSAKTPHAKTALQRQIDATDRQIDKLVYELYGLTDEEIRIVEEATA
jgi:hypothetical protein